ncbi:hypothetical protein [Thermoactinomyces sp. CICC 10523]|uniref:hypothetical protein n=1 Tax=Thermoactinomyces sp. CICC 10523 TaxID=2767428 RepID=UPI0018DDA16E|nr:hypothetical protein [Thermoactinomyces sp. CICC 10523]MBH8599598.1 hypothetical protein [Thermoactinomyces sp. CICC 10523]
MSKWRLEILKHEGKEVVLNPTWDQIKSALNQMDGYDTLDNILLVSSKNGHFTITGGNRIKGKKLYHVFSMDCEGADANLVNPLVSKSDEEYLQITVQRVGFELPKKYLVEYHDMIKAVKHFFETGELTKDQEWE